MTKTIATHSGAFHADESLAVFMLKTLPRVHRCWTRDADVIAKADVVVDVGGEYVPERNRFDHHQRGFEHSFDATHTIKLSSAGLIYKHFGKQVIASILNWPLADPRLDLLYIRMYDEFVEGFDGIDNGVNRYPSDVKPRYKDGTGIASRVARLNPWWNEEGVDVMQSSCLTQLQMTGEEFTDKVRYTALSWLPAREIVEKGLTTRFDVDASGHIILFEQFSPWKEHLHILEKETNVPEAQQPLYVIYPDESGKWRVQAVPKESESFESRKPLPEPWRGVRDDALSTLSGIPGCIFVHASGFIGGNATKDGAIQMAKKALTF
ncbi:GAMM1 protein [Zopfochytrium polystomum]|nr:GAMM1 protein [Zopfochytrium polystomum]